MESLQSLGIVEGEMTSSARWRSFFSMFTFATMALYLQLKITPVITNVAADLGMATTSAGMLVSAFALVALVLAAPAAAVMHKLGIKATLVLAGLIAIVGTIIGIVGGNVAAIMLSRALEGVSLAFGSVVGAAIIPRLFEGKGMGLAMGIWSLWTLPGNIVVFISAPLLYSAGGWRAIWIFALAFEALSTLWLWLDFKIPADSDQPAVMPEQGASTQRKPHMVSAMFVALCMLFWTIAMGSFMVYYPTYLQAVKGVSTMAASIITMVFSIIAAPFGIWFGVLSEKLRARKWFICIPFAIVAVLYATIGFSMSASIVPTVVFIIIFGICGAAIPMGIYALVPELARDRKKTDYAMGVTGIGMQAGNVLVGMCGPIIASLGYNGYALAIIVPTSILAAVGVLLAKSERAD